MDWYNHKKLFSGVFISLALRIIGAVFALALNLAIGRILGAEGAGVYYLALSISSIGAVIARLGMDHAALRFVASETANDNWNGAAGVLVQATKAITISGLIVSFLVYAMAELISENVFAEPNLTRPLRWISLSIVTFGLMMLFSETLKGVWRTRDAMLVSGVIYPVVALAVIWPFTTFAGASGAALAYVLGTSVAMLVGFIIWLRQGSLSWIRPAFDFNKLWTSAHRLWIMSVINSAILPWMPLFLLGIWGSTADTGIFGAAVRLATLLTFLLAAVNTVAAPQFSALYEKGDLQSLQWLACRFSLIVITATGPVVVLMVWQSSWLMGMFGEDFVLGGTALSILLLGHTINAATGSVGYLLMMTGHEKDMRNSSIFAAVLLGSTAMILIPTYGILGAAIASAVATVGVNIYNSIAVKLRLGFFVIPK